jgi:thioredoxin reductase
MATEKQKEAARRNIEKAREVQSERAHGEDVPRNSEGLSTAEKDRLPEAEFAFPSERKEPLSDAAHVRNAIARFDQVEGVSDEERDRAWQRIRTAAGKYGVHVSEQDWRDLSHRGNDSRLRDRAAAQQRGGGLARQRAAAVRQLHDDRVLVEGGPHQAVRERHLGTFRLADQELGWLAPDPVAHAGQGGLGHVSRQQQHRDLLLGQLLGDVLDAAHRARGRPRGALGHQVTDGADGGGGDLVEGGADRGAEVSVAAVGLAAARDGGDRPDRLRQMAGDGVQNVLVTRAEHDVRGRAFGRLGDAPGDELGVRPAAALRLAVGQVPLAVQLPGWPARIRVVLRAGPVADREPQGGLVAAGVRDDVGAVTVGQHHDAGGPPGRHRGHLKQVRQRPYPHRGLARAGRNPPGKENLPVGRHHDAGAAGQRLIGAGGQRFGAALIGAELAGLADSIGPGHLPGILPFGRRIRHRDGGGYHQAGRGRTGLPGAQRGVQPQSAELKKRERDLCFACHGPISAGGQLVGQHRGWVIRHAGACVRVEAMTTLPGPAGEAAAYPVLAETQRDRLRRYGTVRRVTAGQILYSPANESNDLLVVLSGEVVVSNDALGTSVELARHGPGHFAGELNMLTGQRPFLTARAATDGRVLALTPAQVREVLARETDVADLLLRALIARRRRHISGATPGVAVEIIGSGHSAAALALRTFLNRNTVAYQWVDVDQTDQAAQILDATAPGGQAGSSSRIENYLGFPDGISGAELTTRAAIQAQRFGALLASPCRVNSVAVSADGSFAVGLADGASIAARTLVAASGARFRRLALPNWERLEGAGIYYAATELEAGSSSSSHVFVLGGGNSAGQAALYLARRCPRVTIVVNQDSPSTSMSQYLIFRVAASDRIEVTTSSEVVAVDGAGHLESIAVRNMVTGAVTQAAASGLFCFIGAQPASAWLPEQVARDGERFVLTDVAVPAGPVPAGPPSRRARLPYETAVDGLFAAGDIRAGSMKRVASAVGEGSSVIQSVHQYLTNFAD